jgi:uncharacterized protein (TIGR02270 family)
MGAPHIPLIVELHAEDAAILWLQRDRAVDAPHFNRTFLARLDERLEANLDGLRAAGDAGWREALRAFEAHREPGEMFALASLAFGRGRDEIEVVLASLAADAAGALLRPAISALGWFRPRELAGKVQPLLDDPRPVARLLGLGACSVHRVDPNDHLARFVADEPPVRARALRLAGELGRADLLPAVLRHLDDEDDDCRFFAEWSAGLLGDRRRAPQALRARAARGGAHRWRAFDLAMRLGSSDDARGWLQDLRGHPLGREFQVRAAGILSEVALLPFLIERLADPALARIAGESFSMITGVDLAFEDLDGEPPDDLPTIPNDDPDDPRTELDADDELPWPDPAAIGRWHATNADALRQTPRRFLGQPWGGEAFRLGLERGFQRQRRAAAFNLAVASPDAVLSNWRHRNPDSFP